MKSCAKNCAEKATVKAILQSANAFKWSIQGFGMLRLHMDFNVRMNVWDSRFAVPNVSLIHTHPWDFVSHVVAGCVLNRTFDMWEAGWPSNQASKFGTPYMRQRFRPGVGCFHAGEASRVFLSPKSDERTYEGHVYKQGATQIHSSHPMDGTVTVLERTMINADDMTFTFWPEGTDWVSAEPREATPAEVEKIVSASLARWFK